MWVLVQRCFWVEAGCSVAPAGPVLEHEACLNIKWAIPCTRGGSRQPCEMMEERRGNPMCLRGQRPVLYIFLVCYQQSHAPTGAAK